MTTKFLLTPTLEHILIGRGMHLICCAPHCLHETGEPNKNYDDPYFERKITTHGHGKCSRCGGETAVQFFEHVDNNASKKQYRSHKDMTIPACEHCGNIKDIKVIYTQWVISKHRKSRHYYYHAECYERMFVGDSGDNQEKLFKRKQYKMRYAGSGGGGCTIFLPFDPRMGVCSACGKSRHKILENGEPEIKLTSLHHWKYAYAPDTVKKNPILILENTVEVCFACHQVADGLRGIMKMSPERALNVMVKMPKDLLTKFATICRMYLEWYKNNE